MSIHSWCRSIPSRWAILHQPKIYLLSICSCFVLQFMCYFQNSSVVVHFFLLWIRFLASRCILIPCSIFLIHLDSFLTSYCFWIVRFLVPRVVLSLTTSWRFLLMWSNFLACGSNWHHVRCSLALGWPSLVVRISFLASAEEIFMLWVWPILHVSFSCLWRMQSFVADPDVFWMLYILLYLILWEIA